MTNDERKVTDRRAFLQTGAMAAAAAASLTPGLKGQEAPADANVKTPALPRRTLGKTGVEITMLDQGAVRGESLERILRFSFASGVRVFDTRQGLRLRAQLQEVVRQDARGPQADLPGHQGRAQDRRQILAMVDERLAALGTDYIDLFFIHGLGDDHSLDDAINLVKSQELKETAEAIRRSRARPSSSASRPTTRTAPRSSRRRPRGGSSTRSCSSTPPGSTRTPRSTRRSTPAGSGGSA